MNPLPVDYMDSHIRHWEDAEFLYNDHRLPNADHLYGFSAECGLKAVLLKLGMRVDQLGRPESSGLRIHIQGLWPKFKGTVNGRAGGWFLSKLPSGSPFADWSHHDRYSHRTAIQHGNVETHRKAAMGILTMISRARKEGLM